MTDGKKVLYLKGRYVNIFKALCDPEIVNTPEEMNLMELIATGNYDPPEPPESETPTLRKVRARDTYNMRSGAGTNHARIGYFQGGTTAEALEEIQDGDDIWLRVGYGQFVAYRHKGTQFCEYVDG